jgi:hypothetical protein
MDKIPDLLNPKLTGLTIIQIDYRPTSITEIYIKAHSTTYISNDISASRCLVCIFTVLNPLEINGQPDWFHHHRQVPIESNYSRCRQASSTSFLL